MKNKNYFWTVGIIILVALFAISCTARSGSTAGAGAESTQAGTESAQAAAAQATGGPTFTVTGIPSQYNGRYAYFNTTRWSSNTARPWSQDIGIRISNGRVSMPSMLDYSLIEQPYEGNDTLRVELEILSSSTMSNSEEVFYAVVWFDSVRFNNGSATVVWSTGEIRYQR